jgi:hypothetical protein
MTSRSRHGRSIHLDRVAGCAGRCRLGSAGGLLLIAWGLAGSGLLDAAPGYTCAALLDGGAGRHGRLLRVEVIVLWLLGGVSRLKGEAAGPDTERRVSIARPATSAPLSIVETTLGGVLVRQVMTSKPLVVPPG